jgi:hypothetical protein
MKYVSSELESVLKVTRRLTECSASTKGNTVWKIRTGAKVTGINR